MLINEEQRKIIYDNNRYVLVNAGAGTGKTTTIAYKVHFLLQNKNIDPNEIICISFTNESVSNLKQKIKDVSNENVDCYTFHKLGLLILKDKNYNISSPDLLNFIISEYFYGYIYNYPEHIKLVLSYLTIKYTNYNYINKYKNLKGTVIDNLILFIERFISLVKTNNYDNKFLLKLISIEQRKKYKKILIVIYYIYNLYESELTSTNSIDFDDMINKASCYIKENKFFKNIKFLIIDEFQDTSNSKLNLIRTIVDKTNCNLLAVGDDFQSIYKFTGCDIDIFLNFKNHFESSKIYRLETTYRNSQNLISIAGNFIMKNKKQIYKSLVSSINNEKPIVIIYYRSLVDSIIKLIEYLHKKTEETILILGRNNFDINPLIDSKLFLLKDDELVYINKKEIKIKYLTVHRAKGLEFQNVIIINMLNKKNGFPNKIKANYLLKYFYKDQKEIEYAEERRLFYVAITRTKDTNYILTIKNKESVFVKELIKSNGKHINIIRK